MNSTNIKIFVVWIMLSGFLYAQARIDGIILNKETGKPVTNANVYILKTLLGSSTDKNGRFSIKNIPAGIFYIVFSHVNYQTEKKKIKVVPDSHFNFEVKLKPKIYQLPEVTVEEKENEEWEDQFELFKKQLLGTSYFAKQCEILNPYSIEFSETEDGWLHAKCKEAIKINNYALGYKITYFLDSFETNGITTRFSGLPHFTEMTPANKDDEEIYKENRTVAYCGSITHFLRALVEQYNFLAEQDSSIELDDTLASIVAYKLNSKLAENGFTVLSCSHLPWKMQINPIIYPVDVSKIISKAEDKHYYTLTFPNYLQITYDREWEDQEYLDMLGLYNNVPDYQTSWIKLHKFYVLLDDKGHFFDEFAIETFGYWAFEKLGEMLPFEYEISDSMLTSVNWTY